ncbi:hypothetical protein TWF225_009345 [Orbilia oligospora]|nr:hypothetical protein TWF225_009345 [Orbilia oligospora]KAF3269983.1 hypothetical protein TWF217_008329 [Orbilia oligospora]KAF3270448.1 hypothetical protein TWF128_004221 [Orbilia oligospora]KAF3298066.1 hypothetical protein TWF132_004205 [Orbilia oligospora]
MAEKWDAWGPAEKPGVYPRQNFALAVVAGTPLISLAFTSLRLHAKRKSGWGLDDLTITLATLLSIVIIYPSWRYIKLWHSGIHIWDINQRRLEPPMDQSYKMLTWFNVCNAFILPLVKASILFLLLKVGGVIDNVRKFVYGVFVVNAISCLVVAVFFIFQCPQRSGNKWHDRTFGGLRCSGRIIIGRICIFQVCINMFTDLLIFPIPCYLTWKLQKASLRNRLIVVFLFSLSLAVTGIGAAKIYYTYRDRLYVSASDDWTYEIIFTINHWENCVAIVVACVPSLRVLILRWLGKEEGQSYAGSGGSPIRITGGNGPSASVGQTQKSARESFLAKLRPPPKRRGLYDTTIGDQTIDLESCVVKPRFGETIMEDDHDGASCGSKTEINFYRSASVSTTDMSDDVIEKPAPTTPKH